MSTEKPYAESCDQNREPILEVLHRHFHDRRRVLEIGSGTGQHAVYFAGRMPHLHWQPSDVAAHLAGIDLWRAEAGLPNIGAPVELDVTRAWPGVDCDAVFSANTAHIMGWRAVQAMFRGVAGVLGPGGLFLLYGPFNYRGGYTAPSNERFDAWLRQRDPDSGIRDFEALDALAEEGGLRLAEDCEMPVNNRILAWRKAPGV